MTALIGWKLHHFLILPFCVSSFEMHMFVSEGLLKPHYWGHKINKSFKVPGYDGCPSPPYNPERLLLKGPADVFDTVSC